MFIEKSNQIVEMITILMCIHMLYGKKFVLNLPAVIVVGMSLVVSEIVNIYQFPKYSNIVVYIALIVYAIWLFDSSMKDLVVNIVLLMINIGFLHIVTILAAVFIFSVKSEDISLGCNVSVFVLTLLVDKFIGYAKLKKHILSQKSFSVVAASVCMISVVYGLFSIRITGTGSIIFFAWVVIFCSITSIICYQWLRQKELTKEKEIDLQVYELYYDSFQALLKELRARQHDFKNHIQAIRNQHIVCNDYDSLVRAQRIYCDEILQSIKYTGLLRCNNSIIAGFLYGKFVEMKKNGISVQYEVTVYSQQYSIPLYVIIETLGILLDNALEYVTNRQNAEIEVMVCESSSNLRIKVKNPIEKISTVEFMSYFELDKSTKGQGRGIGLTKIKQYSEKYEWNIIVGMEDGAENNKIVIEIVIPICSEVKANIL